MASHQSLHTNEHGWLDGDHDHDHDEDEDDVTIFSMFRDEKDQLCPPRAESGDQFLFQTQIKTHGTGLFVYACMVRGQTVRDPICQEHVVIEWALGKLGPGAPGAQLSGAQLSGAQLSGGQ